MYLYSTCILYRQGIPDLLERRGRVSLARLDDMVDQDSEPKVGDSVKVRFQRLVCQGQVAEVGTAQVIQHDFLDGTYTPFSRKRPASPLPPSVL